jgi:hypothetical protein
MSWTTPVDIRKHLERRWDKGHLLVPPTGDTLFPLSLRFSRPGARDLSERFDEVRRWIRELDEESKPRTGAGYEVLWEEINHRQLGQNRVPAGIVVPTRKDALLLIGKQRAADRFASLVEMTDRSVPVLTSWITQHPLLALEHADGWDRILATVAWFAAHPRSGVYLRQVDVPSVDTKFVEERRVIFASMLDHALAADAIDPTMSPTRQFESRYGLRTKPAMVRFRVLDLRFAIRGLTDLAIPAEQFAKLDLPTRRVFITENEINGLAFPDVPESIVIFGLGYGLDRLGDCAWMRDRNIHYWGDIDTHGFSMLDRLRSAFPAAQSMLMDEETLLAHRTHWVNEPVQHLQSLERLTILEHQLVDALRADKFGPKVRLEQERIGFGWVKQALAVL